MRPSKLQTMIIFAALLLMVLSGCNNMTPQEARESWTSQITQLESVSQNLDAEIEAIQAVIEEQQATIDTLPPDLADQINAGIEKAQGVMADMMAKNATLQTQIAQAQSAIDSLPADATAGEINAVGVGQTVSGVGTLIPQPWGTIIGAAGILISSIGMKRARRNRRVAESVVHSVDVALDSSEALRTEWKNNGVLIRMAQGSENSKIIDKMRKPRK